MSRRPLILFIAAVLLAWSGSPRQGEAAPLSVPRIDAEQARELKQIRWDGRRWYGPRYRYRRPGYTYFYGGWWYPFAWWSSPALIYRPYRPYYYYDRPYYRPRVASRSCEYWRDRCIANWGYANNDFRGCMRYHGCY